MAGRNRPAAAADGSKEFFEEANRWGTVDEEAAAGVDERRSVVGKAVRLGPPRLGCGPVVAQ
jgi:hypothetical protein